MKNIDVNEQTKNVMLGVITGAGIGLAVASLIYKLRLQEKEENDVRKNRIHELVELILKSSGEQEEYSTDDTYCDCMHEDSALCDCGGVCECHSEGEDE